MSTQHGPRFAKETLQGQLTSQASCSQTTLVMALPLSTEISASQFWLWDELYDLCSDDCQAPCSSIHLERYGTIALSQKGMLAFKLSSHKVQSVWQQLQSTYLSQGPIYLLCICTRFHKQLHLSKEHKSYLTCLRHCTTVQTPVKNMKTNSQQGFPFRLKYSSKQFPLPTQFRSFPMTHYMSQSNALTTAVQT